MKINHFNLKNCFINVFKRHEIKLKRLNGYLFLKIIISVVVFLLLQRDIFYTQFFYFLLLLEFEFDSKKSSLNSDFFFAVWPAADVGSSSSCVLYEFISCYFILLLLFAVGRLFFLSNLNELEFLRRRFLRFLSDLKEKNKFLMKNTRNEMSQM